MQPNFITAVCNIAFHYRSRWDCSRGQRGGIEAASLRRFSDLLAAHQGSLYDILPSALSQQLPELS